MALGGMGPTWELGFHGQRPGSNPVACRAQASTRWTVSGALSCRTQKLLFRLLLFLLLLWLVFLTHAGEARFGKLRQRILKLLFDRYLCFGQGIGGDWLSVKLSLITHPFRVAAIHFGHQ